MADTLEVPCPACGARAHAPFHVERGWRYVRCRRCRTVYLNPRPAPDRVRLHYRDYLPDGPAAIREWRDAQEPLVRRAARLLSRRLPPGARVLDVGSGYGFLLRALADAGLHPLGVEISATGAAHARALGVEVREAPLEEARLPDASFAAVCAFYVIEHLEDPRAFLREARRVLAPGGLLLLRWPESAPLVRWCRLLGVRIDLYDAPSHLTDFNPGSLAALLEECGFSGVRTRPGGSTRQSHWIPRTAGVLGALAGDALWALTAGRVLAPGPSKTTTARAAPGGEPEPRDAKPETT